MKKLLKKLFFNPAIQKRIKLLEIENMNLMISILASMSQQEKANIFCKGKEIDFAIDVLNGMLKN